MVIEGKWDIIITIIIIIIIIIIMMLLVSLCEDSLPEVNSQDSQSREMLLYGYRANKGR